MGRARLAAAARLIVTNAEWETAQWQRAHTVKNLRQLLAVYGDLFPADLLASIERDQAERATMSMLLPPQMLNTMDERDLWADPVRRYMLPAFDDRDPEWPSHPVDPRQPARGRHVGGRGPDPPLPHQGPGRAAHPAPSTAATAPAWTWSATPPRRWPSTSSVNGIRHEQILDYLRRTPSVRDVVVSGGDVANLPIRVLEQFVSALLDIDNIRDIRLASKGLMGLPQHFLQDDVLAGLERLATKASDRGVDLALHPTSTTPTSSPRWCPRPPGPCTTWASATSATRGSCSPGVNATPKDLLELCFTCSTGPRSCPTTSTSPT